MAIEVGFRYPMNTKVCEGDACKDVEMKPGQIYEVRVTVSERVPWSDPSNLDKLYHAISAVRQKYPGVCINYIAVDDSGKNIVIQMFDPRPREYGLFVTAILIIAILAILLPVGMYLGMSVYTMVTHKPAPLPPGMHYPATKEEREKQEQMIRYATYAGLAVAGVAAAGYLIGKLAKLEKWEKIKSWFRR